MPFSQAGGALLFHLLSRLYTYKRFHDREDQKPPMLQALQRLLADAFSISASAAEISEGEHLIDAASPFESAVLADLGVAQLNTTLVDDYSRRVVSLAEQAPFHAAGDALHARGLAVRGAAPLGLQVTAAAWLLFGPRPADRYPQCEILVDAYDDVRLGGRPKGLARPASTHRSLWPYEPRLISSTSTRCTRGGWWG